MKFEILCCPVCHGDLKQTDKYIICEKCGRNYPLATNNDVTLPLLIVDNEYHQVMLDKAFRDKPSWFIAPQIREENNPWRFILEKRRRFIQSVLKKELKKHRGGVFPTLLDLGCGDGNNALWLKEYAEALYISDYNPVRLFRAASILPEAISFLADVCQYPTYSNSFDCIYFNHVLEHIKDDFSALCEVYRILKPGGLLILGVPNEGAFFWQLAYKRQPGSIKSSDHCQYYTASSLAEKVCRAGLEICSIKHLGWGPPSWKWEEKLNKRRISHEIINFIGNFFLRDQSSALYLIARKKPKNDKL